MPLDVNRVIDEVKGGLSNVRARLDRAREAADFYRFDGQQHMGRFLNDAETVYDYIKRPYRESGITYEIVRVLTQHLYSPGPSREWDESAGNEFLRRVYEDNHIDAVMLWADRFSTIGDVVAIQIDADLATFDDRPIRLRRWAADEFHAWEDPDDRSRVAAVVTRDMYDLQTRYRLWTEEKVYTLVTKRADGTAGGRVADILTTDDNTYGCIPFAFVHYEDPGADFWTPGIGDFIRAAEVRANDRLSRLDQAIHKHLNPIPTVRNAPDGWSMLFQPGQFIRLPSRAMVQDGSGGYGAAREVELDYLSVQIDVANAWEDLRGFVNQVLEAVGVPASAVRMEQTGVASGIALMVEQAPLLTRVRARRPQFALYETDLARTILRCAGRHYGRRDLEASAKSGRLGVGWQEPTVPVQTDDWYDLQMKRVASGTMSLVEVGMQIWQCQRNDALRRFEQIEKDNADLRKAMPEFAAQQEAQFAAQNGIDTTERDQRMKGDYQKQGKEDDAL